MKIKYRIRFYFLRVFNRLLKIFNITIYYQTNCGIKVLNRKTGKIKEKGNDCFLNPEELFLGIDGLKDNYSLIDVCCTDSPHAELMKKCETKDLTNCEYIHREQIGALDGRDTVFYENEFHLNQYYKKLKRINDKERPVLFYIVNGVRYIADGKHRAALCHLLNQKVYCREIEFDDITIEYFRQLAYKMKKNKEHYKKNLRLLSEILKKVGD